MRSFGQRLDVGMPPLAAVLSVLIAALLVVAPPAAAAEGVTPMSPLLSGTDLVVVGSLHDVSVDRSSMAAHGVGALMISEVVLGDERPGRQLMLHWTEAFDMAMDPRAIDRRSVWFLRLAADGHVETFLNSGHFAADECVSLRDLQRRLESFAGEEADQEKASIALEWLRERLPTICHAAPAEGDGSPLDPKILARIEREFTQPVCGMSGAEGMVSQLDGLHIKNPMPYLVHMAMKSYPRGMAGLNVDATALIGARSDPRAQETLRRLYLGGELSLPAQLSAATWLAGRFHDATGLPLMKPRLRSTAVYVRADALSYMGDVLTESDVPQVLPLASDKHVYVLERFALVMNTRPEFRRLVLPHLSRRLREVQRGDAARMGFVLVLAGDTSGSSFVSDYLLGYTAPVDVESLRQFVSWCNDLSRAGHRLGLDATVHLFELNPAGGRDEWLRQAIMTFGVATEFPHWWTHSEAENLQTAAAAVEWWKRNRDLVSFDAARKKFVVRAGS